MNCRKTTSLLIFASIFVLLVGLSSATGCPNCKKYDDKYWLINDGLWANCCPDNDGDGVPGCSGVSYCEVSCDNVSGSWGGWCDDRTGWPSINENATSPDCNDSDAKNYPNSWNIRADLDPKYVNRTIQERKFDPRESGKITPFDDIRITRTGACSSNEWVYVGIEFKANGTVIAWRTASLSGTAIPFGDEGSFVLQGWPDGLVGGEAMENLTKAIAEGKDISIRVYDYVNQNRSAEVALLAMSNCVHISGNGNLKLVAMRGKSLNLTAQDFINVDLKKILTSVDPFLKYGNKLSSYVDLVNHNDSFHSPFFGRPGDDTAMIYSSCDDGDKFYFFSAGIYGGFTLINGNSVYINPIQMRNRRVDLAIIHETGHALCGIKDEYVYKNQPERSYRENMVWTNCVINPASSYRNPTDNVIYGGNKLYQGCVRNYLSPEPVDPREKTSIYRPSENSIMRYHWIAPKFNVISCGYCIKALTGKSAQESWPECNTLDTIDSGKYG